MLKMVTVTWWNCLAKVASSFLIHPMTTAVKLDASWELLNNGEEARPGCFAAGSYKENAAMVPGILATLLSLSSKGRRP